MTRPVPGCAVDFVADHEGLRLAAYDDGAGTWTIGYGHTAGIEAGMTCTEQQAKFWLESDLRTAAQRLSGVVKAEVLESLSDEQYAALLSWVFNLGTPGGATLYEVLNAKQFARVPDELRKWVYAGGKKLQGLVNRREDEAKLWLTPEPEPEPQPLAIPEREIAEPVVSETKSPVASVTMQGGALALLMSQLPEIAPPLLKLCGVAPELIPDATNALIQAVGLLAGLMVIYGRARAVKRIG